MRYFFAALILIGVVGVGIAGFRGSTSRKPPLQVFPDMDNQPKLRPQTTFSFFADNRSSRLPVAGTISRTEPYQLPGPDGERQVFPYEDAPVNTGRIAGTTNFVETIPMRITAQFMARGRERYDIYCSPCHGLVGDGNGITRKFGMGVVANLHDERIVKMPDGEMFEVITHGRSLMGAYDAQVDVPDRWAIIAYVRALQLSRVASIDDVPEQMRSNLR